MKDATNISDYFNGSKTLFITLYQRKYAWQQKHCIRLFDDLKKILRENIHSHFFGSIDYKEMIITYITRFKSASRMVSC